MSTFPRARKSKLGYAADQVDEFLQTARIAYDSDESADTPKLRAADIRQLAFGMEKGGYSTTHVDAALERLEDAFSVREREAVRAAKGDAAWFDDARTTAQVVLNRLDRPVGHRFDRVSFFTYGYSHADVDRFATRLVRYFQDARPMSIEEVRTVTFRPQRGGYKELQVDLLLDSVTDVMLAVR